MKLENLKNKINKEKQSQSSQEKRINKIVQSTQKQIPVKDITNGVVVTDDNYLVKVLEVDAIPFMNMKRSEQNIKRGLFQAFLKNAPDNFQIKCISQSSNLSDQIEKIKESIKGETNQDRITLCNESILSLEKAQKETVERRYFIAFSNKEKIKQSKVDVIEKEINKINSMAFKIQSALLPIGNKTKILNNNELASLFYMLLNRNTYIDNSFNKHYESVYDKYLQDSKGNEFYIPPTEYLAPQKIVFNDKKFVVCDDRYYSFLYISGNGYPNELYCGWLDTFINSFEGVDVDIFVKKKDRNKVKDQLEKAIGHSENDIVSAKGAIGDGMYKASSKYASAVYLYSGIQSGLNIYDVSIVITVSGKTLEETSEKMEKLIDEANSKDIALVDLIYQEEIAFKSVLPIAKLDRSIESKAKRNMLEDTVSSLYAFLGFQLIHKNGLILANNLNNNSPVIPDFWDKGVVANPHVFACGSSGKGKTSTSALITLHANVLDVPCYILVAEKQEDWKKICLALNGQYIEISSGSPHRLNIMDILENDINIQDKKAEMYGRSSAEISYLNLRIAIVIEFICAYFKEATSRHKSILNDALIETYKRKGITSNNNSLWADETHTHYKEMPILSDLADVLKEKGEEELYSILRYLTSGVGAHFNGKTNVNIHNNYIVFGLENNTEEMLPLATYLAEDFCQNKIREDREKHAVFCIDEGWGMLKTEATAKKMEADAKLLRGFGCMMIFATQQMQDVFSSKEGQSIIHNCETNIIMGLTASDANYVAEMIDLTKQEVSTIRNFNIGDALLLMGSNRLPIHFKPTEYEQLIVFNDDDTNKRYREYMRHKKRQKEFDEIRKKRVAKAGLIDKLFTAYLPNNMSKTLTEKEYEESFSKDVIKAINSEDYAKYLLKGKRSNNVRTK